MLGRRHMPIYCVVCAVWLTVRAQGYVTRKIRRATKQHSLGCSGGSGSRLLRFEKNLWRCSVSGRPRRMFVLRRRALALVADSLRADSKQILVLEAVLSTSHSQTGNPRERGNFEKGRGWYHGPGAATFVAATRFLSELNRLLPRGSQIRLAEAFLSNKADRSRHDDDAKLIAQSF